MSRKILHLKGMRDYVIAKELIVEPVKQKKDGVFVTSCHGDGN